MQSAAIAYDWVVENIGKYEVEKLKQTSGKIHDEIEALARQSPIGSHGVFFLPYLMGERSPIWDENTKGGFIGVTLFNQRSDLFRAAYEGVAYALRSVIDCLEENGLFIRDLTLIGGGAKSPFWNEVIGRCLQQTPKDP
ncbi:MAG: FGGY-family carbohydrate kinase [Clostridia bacterium]